jgi:pSer/pThr/pTyr-binding forkhead associated (FHA) protein
MRVQLICENVGFDDIEFELSENPLVLGRSLRSDVQVVHPLISRFHCEWKLVEGDLVVRDLESTNHTLINGDAIDQAVLHPGDRILLGDVLYLVDFEDIRAEIPRSRAKESSDPESDPEATTTRLGVNTISSPAH